MFLFIEDGPLCSSPVREKTSQGQRRHQSSRRNSRQSTSACFVSLGSTSSCSCATKSEEKRKKLFLGVVQSSLLTRQIVLKQSQLLVILMWRLFSLLVVVLPARWCCLRVGLVGICPPHFPASKIQCCTGTRSGASNRDQVLLCQSSTEDLIQLVFHLWSGEGQHLWRWLRIRRLSRQISAVLFYGCFALLASTICITWLTTPAISLNSWCTVQVVLFLPRAESA